MQNNNLCLTRILRLPADWKRAVQHAVLFVLFSSGCAFAADEPAQSGDFMDRRLVPLRIYGTEFTDPESAPQLLGDTIAALRRAL